jgi:hypothetical protein
MQVNPAKKKPAYKPRDCERCGVSFTPLSGRAKRCPDCRGEHRAEWKKDYNHSYYEANQLGLVEYAAQYRAEHPDEHRAASKRWQEANPDRKLSNDVAYRERNRPRLRVKNRVFSRESYIRHAEKRRAEARQYAADNPEKVREACRRWLAAHPEFRSAANSRRRIKRRTGLTAQDGRMSLARRTEIRDDPCFYCGGPGEEYEHYFPVAKGGTDIWANILRSCLPCNRGRGGKHEMCGTAFMLRNGTWKPFLPQEPVIKPRAA